jgi:hypothetical protein
MTTQVDTFSLSTDSENHGFMMRLPNSIIVSVRWGSSNYCDQGVTTAECAAWIRRADRNEGRRVWIQIGSFPYGHVDGQILSDMTAADVLQFLADAAGTDVDTISNERLIDGF